MELGAEPGCGPRGGDSVGYVTKLPYPPSRGGCRITGQGLLMAVACYCRSSFSTSPFSERCLKIYVCVIFHNIRPFQVH